MNAQTARKLISKHQQALNLGEWTIVPLMRTGDTLPGEAGDWGRVNYNPERLEAVIELPTGRTDAETEQTICHELAHLLLKEYEGIVHATLESLEGDVRNPLLVLLKQAEERLCHRVGRALSGVIPMQHVNLEDFVRADADE